MIFSLKCCFSYYISYNYYKLFVVIYIKFENEDLEQKIKNPLIFLLVCQIFPAFIRQSAYNKLFDPLQLKHDF